jgi:phospholipase A1/A2
MSWRSFRVGRRSLAMTQRKGEAPVWRGACALAVAALSLPAAAADPAAACAAEHDDRARLACYDKLFRPRDRPPAEATPPSVAPAGEPPIAPPGSKAAGAEAAPASAMSRLWELDRAHKHGTFLVKTYLPNFVLPLHVTSHLDRAPSSPTHPAPPSNDSYQHAEVKLQISLRAKVAQSVLLPDADLWFAYTQRSMWQLWDHADSAPFRSTDYQPEAIYVVPIPATAAALPGGWRWRMLQAGAVHQSNGQSDPLSRSWNRAFLGAAFERGDVALQLRAMHRLPEDGPDDNPDLTHYIGGGEAVLNWLPGLSIAALTWRTGLSLRRGSVQLDWTYPVDSEQPLGLRWYLQLFSGYGETLLEYNRRQTSVGFGLTLFQF